MALSGASREQKSDSFFSFTASAHHSYAEPIARKWDGKGNWSHICSIINIPNTNYFVTLSNLEGNLFYSPVTPKDQSRGEFTFWLCEENQFKKCYSYSSACDIPKTLFIDDNNNLIICGKKDEQSVLECWDLSSGFDKARRTAIRVVDNRNIWLTGVVLLVTLTNGDLLYSARRSTQIFHLKAGESKSHKIELKSFCGSIMGMFLRPDNKLLVIAENQFPPGKKGLKDIPEDERDHPLVGERIYCLDLDQILKSHQCSEAMLSREIFLSHLGIDYSAEHTIMLRNGEIALSNGKEVFLFDPMNLIPSSAKKLCDSPDLIDGIAEAPNGRLLIVKNSREFGPSISLSQQDKRLMDDTIRSKYGEHIDNLLPLSFSRDVKKIVAGYCGFHGFYRPVPRTLTVKQEQKTDADARQGHKPG